MSRVWQVLGGVPAAGGIFTPENVLLSLLLAFVLGQVLAWVYYFTHSGLSYSKSFVQSLILITVVVAMVMAVIGSSIITAIGLMGALAIIRFRNIIKDTRDIAFIFCSLVVGMAAGSHRFAIAILGTMVLSLIAMYLYYSNFGARQPRNAFLRFSLQEPMGPKSLITAILRRFCGSFSLISAEEGGPDTPMMEYAYQLMIRDPERNEELLAELGKVEGIENVNLTMQEQLLEV